MGNCLVTKLKGVVDNDNLKKFNTFKIRLRQISEVVGAANALLLETKVPITVTAIGAGNKVSVSNSGVWDTSIELPVGTVGFEVENKDYEVEVSPKYGSITSFKVPVVSGNTVIAVDVDELNYTELDEVFINGFNTIGDIASLASVTKIGMLRCGVHGDICSLAGKTLSKLAQKGGLEFSYCPNLTGNLNSLTLADDIGGIFIPYSPGIVCDINTLAIPQGGLTAFEAKNDPHVTGSVETFAEHLNVVMKSGYTRLEVTDSGITYNGVAVTDPYLYIVYSQSGYTIQTHAPA